MAKEKNAPENNEHVGVLENHLESQKEGTKVSLVNTIRAKVVKDFGHLKKGHEQDFSEMVFEIYKNKGVVEKL